MSTGDDRPIGRTMVSTHIDPHEAETRSVESQNCSTKALQTGFVTALKAAAVTSGLYYLTWKNSSFFRCVVHRMPGTGIAYPLVAPWQQVYMYMIDIHSAHALDVSKGWAMLTQEQFQCIIAHCTGDYASLLFRLAERRVGHARVSC